MHAFKSKAKRAVKRVLLSSKTVRRFYGAYSMYGFRRHLDEIGWFKSREGKLAVSQTGESLPWFTYPSIAFLNDRIDAGMSVFEYGSGNSTLWWSDRVAEVAACEHDHDWFETMKPKLPANVEYLHHDLEYGGSYSKAISTLAKPFDIVVIDGRDRVNCARNSVPSLSQQGVIIWDNSDRESYSDGYDFLCESGFKRLDFWGIGPINKSGWCTSIFYRDQNCLAL